MATEYEHLVYDISYPALAAVASAVRAALTGAFADETLTDLQNFANECDNRLQHRVYETRRTRTVDNEDMGDLV